MASSIPSGSHSLIEGVLCKKGGLGEVEMIKGMKKILEVLECGFLLLLLKKGENKENKPRCRKESLFRHLEERRTQLP